MTGRLGGLVIAAWLATVSPVVGAAEPEFPPPPQAKVEWVAEDMVMNGIAMRVRRFESPASVEQVLGFYKQRWQDGEKGELGYAETDALEPWQLLSRVERGRLLTVQVQPTASGSWGYLGLSDLPQFKGAPRLGEGFPKLSGSRVLNDIVSNDPGKRGRSLLIANSLSIGINAAYYRDHYENEGWHKVMDEIGGRGALRTLVYASGREKVSMVILKFEGETHIIAHDVTEGGL
ncbi:MAG TPA: hypothetical protein VMH34_04000 [Gammaproteobacteria bacterium]|nr:hypothetical protein [Gammaproteobacteria bacterium]